MLCDTSYCPCTPPVLVYEWGQKCRWSNKHRPQHLIQALSRSSSDADFLLSSAVQEIAFCFIPVQKPGTQSVSSALSKAKVSWQNNSSELHVNLKVHGDTRYPFSRLDFITFQHFTFVILWDFFFKPHSLHNIPFCKMQQDFWQYPSKLIKNCRHKVPYCAWHVI